MLLSCKNCNKKHIFMLYKNEKLKKILYIAYNKKMYIKIKPDVNYFIIGNIKIYLVYLGIYL